MRPYHQRYSIAGVINSKDEIMLATHIEAEQRYAYLRQQAIQVTAETIYAQGVQDIKLTTITNEALSASKRWESSTFRQVDWDWIQGYWAFKFRYPKRFEMALWDSRQLIGLSLGRPTYQGSALRLDFVEASPEDLGERPAIIEFVLLGYDIYARLVNAKQIRIMNPINKVVRSYYEQFGYNYVNRGNYLFRSVL